MRSSLPGAAPNCNRSGLWGVLGYGRVDRVGPLFCRALKGYAITLVKQGFPFKEVAAVNSVPRVLPSTPHSGHNQATTLRHYTRAKCQLSHRDSLSSSLYRLEPKFIYTDGGIINTPPLTTYSWGPDYSHCSRPPHGSVTRSGPHDAHSIT